MDILGTPRSRRLPDFLPNGQIAIFFLSEYFFIKFLLNVYLYPVTFQCFSQHFGAGRGVIKKIKFQLYKDIIRYYFELRDHWQIG